MFAISDTLTSALIGAAATLAVGLIPVTTAFLVQHRQILQQERHLDQLEIELHAKLTTARRRKMQTEQIVAYQRLWAFTASIRAGLTDGRALGATVRALYEWYNDKGFAIFLSPAAHDGLNRLMYTCWEIATEGPKPGLDKVANNLISEIRQQMRSDLGLFDDPWGGNSTYAGSYTLPSDFILAKPSSPQ